MKKISALTLCLLALFTVKAQVSFIKGYVINNNNEKISCLIKDIDFKNIPKEFEYKRTQDGKVENGSIENFKEFGVNENLRFIRAVVDIDKTIDNIELLDTSSKPNFVKDTLYLKVLADGDANLYYYEYKNLKRYFFSTSQQQKIEQLVYKMYTKEHKTVSYNNHFRQQLSLNLKCDAITLIRLENQLYNNTLIHIFDDYNQCMDANYVALPNKYIFHLTPKIGVKSNMLKFKEHKLDADLSTKVGVELEFVFPFNNGKWAMIVEPSFHKFDAEASIKEYRGGYEDLPIYNDAVVNYSSVELSMGVRHYLNLNNKSKLYFNYIYLFDFVGDSNLKFKNQEYKFGNISYSVLGAGFKYNDKFSAEIRYGIKTNLTWKIVNFESRLDYSNLSFLVGYTIL